MIKEVDLSGTACFAPEAKLEELKKINFIFGPNGSGKTTISKRLDTELDDKPKPGIAWDNNGTGTTLVFNRDFTANALATSARLPGVTFIGKGAATTQANIDTLHQMIQEKQQQIEPIRAKLTSAEEKQTETRKSLELAAWKIKTALDHQPLSECLRGFKDKKSKLADRLLEIAPVEEQQPNETELHNRARRIYSNKLQHINPPDLNWRHQTDPEHIETLLNTPIIPFSESNLRPIVDQYNLFDWVARGYQHSKEVGPNEVCPYCQQELPDNIKEQLDALFDESYSRTIEELKATEQVFNRDLSTLTLLVDQLAFHVESIPELEKERDTLNKMLNAYKTILSNIRTKVEHPSKKVVLTHPLSELNSQIKSALTRCASHFHNHNRIVANLAAEKKELTSDFWSWLAGTKLKDELKTYRSNSKRHCSEIKTHEDKITEIKKEISNLRSTTREKQAELHNTQEAMERVNSILQDLGFTSFKLDYDFSSKGYMIVRPDHPDTPCNISTLSEGEKTILSFLYFIQQIDGSVHSTDTQAPTVIIDDPIASTDAQAFFLVTQIIRRITRFLMESTQNSSAPTFRLSQLIVCTHNTRFLSEASYDCKTGNKKKAPHTHFYTLSKIDTRTIISKGSTSSSVSMEYHLLWDEIIECSKAVTKAKREGKTVPHFPLIGNTMRRIIETYSAMINAGSITKLSTHPSLPLASLVAFCNSSSHNAIDADLHSVFTLSTEQLLGAFRQFFETEFEGGAHFPHYWSMMGEKNLANTGWSYPQTV